MGAYLTIRFAHSSFAWQTSINVLLCYHYTAIPPAMFSSFTSFLPSALQSTPSPPPHPHPHPQEQPTVSQDAMRPDEQPEAVRRKKERTNESFIVVRPPPSKSNHPLNLQVQLVPPSTKEKDHGRPGGQASDAPAEGELITPLSRTGTNRSDTSMYSSYSSVSLASTSSTSSGGGRRMIIPLYNLQAHNVMQNVIVDAGTDAKVAKFLKRGLEMIGLAVLEPVEVWGAAHDNVDYSFAAGAHTPESSAMSLSGSEQLHEQPAVLSPVTSRVPDRERERPKRFLGKLFNNKRKDSAPTAPPLALRPPPSPMSKRTSLLGPPLGFPLEPLVSPSPVSGVILQPPVLGIQPSLSSSRFPPQGRPTKYVWVVRRWLKGGPDSLLGGMKDMLNVSSSGSTGPEGAVEVRFEWTRGKSKSQKRRRRRDEERTKRSSIAISPMTPSTASLQHQLPLQRSHSARRSMDSRRSLSPQRAASITTNTTSNDDDTQDGGEMSDSEDSETPWTCTLVVRPLVPDALAPASSIRVKVAAVVPTPHHPKVVALLKVPFPLPDVAVEQVQLRRRIVTPAGVARPAPPASPSTPLVSPSGKSGKGFFNGGGGEREGLMLSAEEIKDVVSSTGLWLVVREGFGGVGRVNRKGDGWRIRG